MNGTQKYTGRTMSLPGGLAVGMAVSLGITAVSIGSLAKLVDSEIMAWERVGYGIMAMLLAASFLGALTAYHKIKRQRLLICLLAGGTFFCLLLAMTALFFGGQYEGVGTTLLLITAGSGAAGLLGLRQGRGDKHRRIRHLKK